MPGGTELVVADQPSKFLMIDSLLDLLEVGTSATKLFSVGIKQQDRSTSGWSPSERRRKLLPEGFAGIPIGFSCVANQKREPLLASARCREEHPRLRMYNAERAHIPANWLFMAGGNKHGLGQPKLTTQLTFQCRAG